MSIDCGDYAIQVSFGRDARAAASERLAAIRRFESTGNAALESHKPDAVRGNTSGAFSPDSTRCDTLTPHASAIERGFTGGVGASCLGPDVCPHDASLRGGKATAKRGNGVSKGLRRQCTRRCPP